MLGNPPKREWTPKKATPNDIKPKKSGWNISHYGFMERTVYFPTLSVFLIVNESRYTMQDHTWIHGHTIVNYISAGLLHSNVSFRRLEYFVSHPSAKNIIRLGLCFLFLFPIIYWSRLGLEPSVIRAAIAKP